MFCSRIISVINKTLIEINPAWSFHQIEGPILTPKSFVSESYGSDDLFITNHELSGEPLYLRPETTASSYLLLLFRRVSGE